MRLSKDVKKTYNGYTNFIRAVKLPVGAVSSSHWANVPDGCQENWAFGGAKRTATRNQVDGELRQGFLQYSEAGPSGSTDPSLPLDFDDTFDMLSDDILRELKSHFTTSMVSIFFGFPNRIQDRIISYNFVGVKDYLYYATYVCTCFVSRPFILYENGRCRGAARNAVGRFVLFFALGSPGPGFPFWVLFSAAFWTSLARMDCGCEVRPTQPIAVER